MEYKIIENSSLLLGVQLTFMPENQVLTNFFHGMSSVRDLEKLQQSLVTKRGVGYNHGGIIFFGDLDEFEKFANAHGEDEVCVYSNDDEIIEKIETVKGIFVEFATKIAEIDASNTFFIRQIISQLL